MTPKYTKGKLTFPLIPTLCVGMHTLDAPRLLAQSVRIPIRHTGRFSAGIQEAFLDSGWKHARMTARIVITLYCGQGLGCAPHFQQTMPPMATSSAALRSAVL